MAEAVVHCLEAVDIHEKQSVTLTAPLRPAQGMVEMVQE